MMPVEEYYDSHDKTFRRIYSLRGDLIYLSEWSKEGIATQYSVDVEKADDSHYVLSAEEMGKLAEVFHCQNQTADLVKELSAYFRRHGERDFVTLLDAQGIKYRPYHFDSW